MEPIIAGIQSTDKTPKKPVMDVVPPRASETVKMPPPEQNAALNQAAKPHTVSTPAPSKVADHAPHAARGATAAIVASVVIVLGLGMLLVYAYLRTQGISFL